MLFAYFAFPYVYSAGFVVLQYGCQCFCGGDTYLTCERQTPDGNCRRPCCGDSRQTCGNGWRLDVYTTGNFADVFSIFESFSDICNLNRINLKSIGIKTYIVKAFGAMNEH